MSDLFDDQDGGSQEFSKEEMLAEIENAAAQVINGGRNFLEGPLPADLEGAPGVPPLSTLKLAKREVTVQDFACPVGHHHRIISLVESFNTAGAPKGAVIPTLDESFADFRAKAAVVPDDAQGLAEIEGAGATGVNPDTGNVEMVVFLNEGFETAASLSANPFGGNVFFLGPDDDIGEALKDLFGDVPQGPQDDEPSEGGPDFPLPPTRGGPGKKGGPGF